MNAEKYEGPFNEMPLDHIRRFLSSYDSGRFSDVPVLDRKYGQVLIAGMGGSGVVGSIIASLARFVTSIPVDVLRTNRVPAYVGEDTLLVVISYSGNTREMLEMYSEGLSRGCMVIVITAGGSLLERAVRDGTPVMRLDGGFTPRSDIGFAIGYAAAVIDSNCGTDLLGSFVSAIRSAEPYADVLSKREDENNPAMCIAHSISSMTPFIYSMDDLKCVVNRWKCQINENAKIPAACNTFPEFNHNCLEGWSGNSHKSLVPIFIGGADFYADTALQIMAERGNDFLRVDIPGRTDMERIVNGILLGDYVSLYLAHILGVNDSPVYAIAEFKRRIAGH